MNKSEVKDLRDVASHLIQAATERKAIHEKVNSLVLNIEGVEGDHTKDGMIGAVNRNTSFRANSSRLMWLIIPIITSAILGISIKIFFFTPVAAQIP
ncbi:hypothetical protein HQ585_08345 [candidate division KSB1 bacterium]|nr:hypothetical protein [candidate division KSB1 bacterium]